MIKITVVALPFLLLAACGGARGEIGQACAASDRRAANTALCNCIQAAANQHLNARDQRLAATFFEDADRAQEIRARTSAIVSQVSGSLKSSLMTRRMAR